MSRKSRYIIPGAPHHITQRGNRKQQVFFDDSDREFYLYTLTSLAAMYEVVIFAYCLMLNHLHLGLIPKSSVLLSNFMNSVHSKFAARINKRFGWSGHLWQQRFYSSPLDAGGFEKVLSYIEMNPVRANMVERPEDHRWSSARAHVTNSPDELVILNDRLAHGVLRGRSWSDTFHQKQDYSQLRKSHQRNFPFGEEAFIEEQEALSGRSFRELKRGPKVG